MGEKERKKRDDARKAKAEAAQENSRRLENERQQRAIRREEVKWEKAPVETPEEKKERERIQRKAENRKKKEADEESKKKAEEEEGAVRGAVEGFSDQPVPEDDGADDDDEAVQEKGEVKRRADADAEEKKAEEEGKSIAELEASLIPQARPDQNAFDIKKDMLARGIARVRETLASAVAVIEKKQRNRDRLRTERTAYRRKVAISKKIQKQIRHDMAAAAAEPGAAAAAAPVDEKKIEAKVVVLGGGVILAASSGETKKKPVPVGAKAAAAAGAGGGEEKKAKKPKRVVRPVVVPLGGAAGLVTEGEKQDTWKKTIATLRKSEKKANKEIERLVIDRRKLQQEQWALRQSLMMLGREFDKSRRMYDVYANTCRLIRLKEQEIIRARAAEAEEEAEERERRKIEDYEAWLDENPFNTELTYLQLLLHYFTRLLPSEGAGGVVDSREVELRNEVQARLKKRTAEAKQFTMQQAQPAFKDKLAKYGRANTWVPDEGVLERRRRAALIRPDAWNDLFSIGYLARGWKAEWMNRELSQLEADAKQQEEEELAERRRAGKKTSGKGKGKSGKPGDGKAVAVAPALPPGLVVPIEQRSLELYWPAPKQPQPRMPRGPLTPVIGLPASKALVEADAHGKGKGHGVGGSGSAAEALVLAPELVSASERRAAAGAGAEGKVVAAAPVEHYRLIHPPDVFAMLDWIDVPAPLTTGTVLTCVRQLLARVHYYTVDAMKEEFSDEKEETKADDVDVAAKVAAAVLESDANVASKSAAPTPSAASTSPVPSSAVATTSDISSSGSGPATAPTAPTASATPPLLAGWAILVASKKAVASPLVPVTPPTPVLVSSSSSSSASSSLSGESWPLPSASRTRQL